jgi:hypothetical protein
VKRHQFVITHPHRASWLIVFVALCLPAWLCADETTAEGFPILNWEATLEEIQSDLGPPAFAAESILMYSTEVVTGTGTLVADLTLWFRGARLYFASYAFRSVGLPDGGLTVDFESISEQLQLTFNQPASRASTPNSFTTEVWNLEDVDIEHTIILDPGRLDHVVNFTVAQP